MEEKWPEEERKGKKWKKVSMEWKRGKRKEGMEEKWSEEEGGQQDEVKFVEYVIDWVELKRRTKRRPAQGRHEEEGRENRRTVQTLVKVRGFMAFPLEVPLRDNVRAIAKRIPNSACRSKRDVYATCEGRVVRRSDGKKSCGVSDGSTLEVMSRLLGGEKHKDKKSKKEKKQAVSPRISEPVQGQLEQKDAGESESDTSLAIQECNKDAVVQMFVEKRLKKTKSSKSSWSACQKEMTLKWNRRCQILRRQLVGSWDGTRNKQG